MQDYKNIEKICFLGRRHVGKTNLFNRLCGKIYFKPYQPTVKPNFHTRFYAQGAVQYWDFPSEEATFYLGRQQQVVLVFNRNDRRSLADLQAYVALVQKHAPTAIVTVVGITEALALDDFSEEAINAFLERNQIDYEHYLPILTSSPASIHTLFEHLDSIRQQQRNLRQDRNDTPTSSDSEEQARVSPTSIVSMMYRFIGAKNNVKEPTTPKSKSISSPNFSMN